MAGLAGVGLGMQKETSAVPMEGRLQARPMGDENEHENEQCQASMHRCTLKKKQPAVEFSPDGFSCNLA